MHANIVIIYMVLSGHPNKVHKLDGLLWG